MAARVKNARVKRMLQLLSAEAGFLVDAKVRQAIDQLGTGARAEEAAVLKADSILKALGGEGEGDVDMLLSYFFRDEEDDASDDEEDALARAAGRGLRVSQDDVIAVIKEFVVERDRRRSEEEEGAQAAGGLTVAEKAANAARARQRRLEKQFWESMVSGRARRR